MNLPIKAILQVSLLLLGLVASSASHAQEDKLGVVQLSPGEMKFMANPALPSGPETAVLAGDPKKPALYTVRIKIPANFKIQPHWHPEDRMSAVISGTCILDTATSSTKQSSRNCRRGVSSPSQPRNRISPGPNRARWLCR